MTTVRGTGEEAVWPVPGRSVVGKVAGILNVLADQGSANLTGLVRRTGLPRSTVHRLVSELVARQILRRDARGVYRAGPVVGLLVGPGPVRDLVGCAEPVLDDLAGVIGATARLAVLDGSEVVVVAERQAPMVPGPATRPVRRPAHATAAGRVLLAFSSSAVAWTPGRGAPGPAAGTITSSGALDRTLAEIRRTRIATAHSAPGAPTVAAPVFGPGGAAVGALELTVRDLATGGPATRAAVRMAASTLSHTLIVPADVPSPGDRCHRGDVPPLGPPVVASPAPQCACWRARLPSGARPVPAPSGTDRPERPFRPVERAAPGR